MQESMIARSDVGTITIRNCEVIDMDKTHIGVRGNCENPIQESWSTTFIFVQRRLFFRNL
jgi:hypothetical protein